MSNLIELLESLNRKERYHLVKQALGGVELSECFRKKLGEAICQEIPAGSFVAMDYHLDWLAAALRAHRRGGEDRRFCNPKQPEKRVVRGTQEDIDLLVAFQSDKQYHIVMVEAKGATPWSNRQMRSKAGRLKQIFCGEPGCCSDVMPCLCVISPRRPVRLDTKDWPGWMMRSDGAVNWLPLKFPEETKAVVRCDEGGKPSAEGSHFKIESRTVEPDDRLACCAGPADVR